MREMKNSKVDWIGEIPENWKIGKVKDIFIRKNEKSSQENPIVLSLARSGVKIRDITTGEGQLAENYSNYNPVEKGDLLLNPMDLYSGANCSTSEVIGVISPAYINLRIKNNENSKFYDYYFKTQYWSMALFAHGKGVSFDNRWTLGLDTVLNYLIPIPSIEEQNKIVNYLKKKTFEIDNIIKKTQETIEDYKKYKQAIIAEVVTKGIYKNGNMRSCEIDWIKEIPENWKTYKTKEFFEFGKGLPITKADLIDNGEKVISYGQIHSKDNTGTNINEELYRYVSKKYLKSNSQSIAKYNDFIFADTSEDLNGCGNCAYIDKKINLFSGYHTIILKPKTKNEMKYLAYLFLTDNWRIQIRSRVSGIKLFSITQKILKETTIIMPGKEEREEIVKYLDIKCKEIDKLIMNKEKLILELENYKKSLIYEHVTGKKEVFEDVNYSAEDVSNWILDKNLENRRNCKETVGITNLKLQKLLYYASGIYYLYKKSNLIKEDFVAWKHGPVIKEMYYKYNSNGAKEIQHNRKSRTKIDDETQEILEKMYAKYSQYTAEELSNMTHKENPWKKTSRNKIIDKDLIKDYFENGYKWE